MLNRAICADLFIAVSVVSSVRFGLLRGVLVRVLCAARFEFVQTDTPCCPCASERSALWRACTRARWAGGRRAWSTISSPLCRSRSCLTASRSPSRFVSLFALLSRLLPACEPRPGPFPSLLPRCVVVAGVTRVPPRSVGDAVVLFVLRAAGASQCVASLSVELSCLFGSYAEQAC